MVYESMHSVIYVTHYLHSYYHAFSRFRQVSYRAQQKVFNSRYTRLFIHSVTYPQCLSWASRHSYAAPLVLFEKSRLWAGTGFHLLPSFHHHPTQHNYSTQTLTHTVTLTSTSYNTIQILFPHGLLQWCAIRK